MVFTIALNKYGGIRFDIGPAGKILRMIGEPNVISREEKEQSIKIRLLTDEGELPMHPEFGLDYDILLFQVTGYSNVKFSEYHLIRLNFQRALEPDPDLKDYFEMFQVEEVTQRNFHITFEIALSTDETLLIDDVYTRL